MLWAPAMGWLAACAAERPASDSSTEGPCHASPSSARLSCSSSRLTSAVIRSTHLSIGLTVCGSAATAAQPPASVAAEGSATSESSGFQHAANRQVNRHGLPLQLGRLVFPARDRLPIGLLQLRAWRVEMRRSEGLDLNHVAILGNGCLEKKCAVVQPVPTGPAFLGKYYLRATEEPRCRNSSTDMRWRRIRLLTDYHTAT